MSVSQLYLICEGQEHGEDTLVLAKILTGIATVTPEGGKQDLPHRFFWHRKQNPLSRVAVLRDRDFDHEPDEMTLLHQPRPFSRNEPGTGENVLAGWTWERVTIENYLIDPVVVRKAFGERFPIQDYQEALTRAASGLRAYTAARLALSASRIPHGVLANKWKQPHGMEPDNCRARIKFLVSEYSRRHSLDAETVIARFDTLLPVCDQDGPRGAHPLIFFSGEDLLAAMHPALGKMIKLAPKTTFVEAVATRINESQDDVWTWLPEWQALREIVKEGSDL